jgi:hypothetical protein
MSEEAEVPENGEVTVDDVLSAIQQKNLNTAKNHFNTLMGMKVNDSLENEKVRIANATFNGAAEEEEPEEEEEVESEEEDTDIESEVESAFEEEVEESTKVEE